MASSRNLAIGTLISSLLGGGCSSTPADCDPSRADFFKNTACLAGGGYAARQARLERELSQQQQLNREFHAVHAALQNEQLALRSDRVTADARYAELNRAWRDLQAELRRTKGENRELARRIDEIDQTLAGRSAADQSGDLRAKEAQRAELRRKLDLLHRELEAGLYD